MNPFASVGFPMPGEAFDDVVRRVWTDGHHFDVRPGVVQADWAGTSGAGIEVFVVDGTVVYAKPTFRGKPGARARLLAWGTGDNEWCVPVRIEVLGEAEYPATVEIDDIAVAWKWLSDGNEYDVSLALFVREQGLSKDLLAARAALPWGELGDGSTEMAISGEVLSVGRRVNEMTGGAFGHARVASLSAEYDVLFAGIEPLPARGETVRVSGRLFANVRRPAGSR